MPDKTKELYWILPNVTQSFKLQRPDLDICRTEATLGLFSAEHCSNI